MKKQYQLKVTTVLISFIALLSINACKRSNEKFISCSNKNIEYSGRIDSSNNDYFDIFWSGSSIKFNFNGSGIKAILKDERGDNYFNIILDNDSIFVLKADTNITTYTLFSNLKHGNHTIEIFKRTEWDKGKTSFTGFVLDNDAQILPKSTKKSKSIEFYGNSITAGYAVEDTSGLDRPDSIYTNNYLSYSAITVRHFGAKYQCICKSGIGITISWFPLIMPEMYDRLNPADSASKWDFSLYQPDIVVINLFQNDSWLVNHPERDEFKANFGTQPPTDEFLIKAYKQFVLSIRTNYPNSDIICMLGNMDVTKENSNWPNYIIQAVDQLNDSKIHTHFVHFKNTPGHPSIREHEELANSLVEFINANINW